MRIYEKDMLFVRKIFAGFSLLLITIINTIFFEQSYFTRFDGILIFPVMSIVISLYFISIYKNHLYYLLFLFVLFYAILSIIGLLGVHNFFTYGSKFNVRTFQEISRYQPITFKEVDMFWASGSWLIYIIIQISTIMLRSNIYAKVQRISVFFAMYMISKYYQSFLSYMYPIHHRYLFWSVEFSLYFLFSIFFLMLSASMADIMYHKKNKLYLELFLLFIAIFFWLLSMLLEYILISR